AAAALLHIPACFSSAKEVDLESSARIRPLNGSKHRKRSSGGGGGVRNASRPHRMCAAGAPDASTTEDASNGGSGFGPGPGGGQGSTTT
ncbi:unnamed protein product, partial [Laminaria digitata]